MLIGMREDGDRKRTGKDLHAASLSDLGIEQTQASRWMVLARMDENEFEASLTRRWDQLQQVLARIGSDHANFNPLTKHFYIKALSEFGIDQIIANISCVDATLMRESKRKFLMIRYNNLVQEDDALEWIKEAINLRDRYLHSLGDPGDNIDWKELGKTRVATTKAVRNYLDIAFNSTLSRKQLLRFLER